MSERLELNKKDMLKVGKGLLIAMGGAGVAYLAEVVGLIDFGASTPLVVAGAGILLNFLRKLILKQ